MRTIALQFKTFLAVSATFILSMPTTAFSDHDGIIVELNKLESAGAACRAFLIIENHTRRFFSSLKLDLVVFDPAGIVARRIAVETAPLPSNKTMLKVFPVKGLVCEGVSRMLLNDVIACKDDSGTDLECLSLMATRARSGLSFIK